MQTRSSSSSGSLEEAPVLLTAPKKALWTDREEDELIAFLSGEKVDMEPNNTYREPVYGEALTKVRPFHSKGVLKDIKSIKVKWTSVRIYFIRVLPIS